MTQLNLMALRHSAFYSPYLMTMAGGHLKQAGFEVNYQVQSPDNLVQDRLLDGSCHVSQSAVAASFSTLKHSPADPVRHFAQINSRDGFFIASREPCTDFSWQDLAGKSILVDHFFQPLAMFRYALHKQGIKETHLHMIDAGDVQQMDAAFRSGQGDFIHQQGPAPQQMEADGVAHVVASVGDAIGPVAFSSLCAHQDWLSTDMAYTFFAIYQQALQQCNEESPQSLARQLQAYGFLTEINFDVLASTIATYQALGCWNHTGEIGTEEFEVLLDVFSYSGLLEQRPSYTQLITWPGK
ncbi:MAG TPA: ABC transporter substrate-binding protein [Gammaproteobacteria bacterium]